MPRLRTSSIAIALAAAGIGPVLVTGAGTATGQTGQPLILKSKIAKSGFVDQDVGKKGPTSGDATQVRDTLTDADGAPAGRDALSCVRVAKREQECNWTLVLAGGSVQLSGLTRDSDAPYDIPVVGGTGQYVGAAGTMRVTDATKPVATYELSLK